MFFTYITANRKQGALYTGHTDDLIERYWQHRDGIFEGFAKRHGCNKLVWFELHEEREAAFKRERQIKEWNRAWKIELIEKLNPDWFDLGVNAYEEKIYDPRRFFKPETDE